MFRAILFGASSDIMYVVIQSAGNYKIIIKVIHGRTFFASEKLSA